MNSLNREQYRQAEGFGIFSGWTIGDATELSKAIGLVKEQQLSYDDWIQAEGFATLPNPTDEEKDQLRQAIAKNLQKLLFLGALTNEGIEAWLKDCLGALFPYLFAKIHAAELRVSFKDFADKYQGKTVPPSLELDFGDDELACQFIDNWNDCNDVAAIAWALLGISRLAFIAPGVLAFGSYDGQEFVMEQVCLGGGEP